MRTEHLVALILFFSTVSCTRERDADGSLATQQPYDSERPKDLTAAVDIDLFELGILQRTCALYVALKTHAFDGPVTFGGDMNDSMLHWNKCPGGTMVACKVTPTANGDSVITGIPWPYGEGGVE